jgi:hypothetical protein
VNNSYLVIPYTVSHVARVWSCSVFGVIGFYNVVFSVKQLVANQLYLHGTVVKLLNSKHGYVLCFTLIDCNPQNNVVHIPIDIIIHHDVIDHVVAIQVEIVHQSVFIIQISFKIFEGFRFLKQFHYCIEI